MEQNHAHMSYQMFAHAQTASSFSIAVCILRAISAGKKRGTCSSLGVRLGRGSRMAYCLVEIILALYVQKCAWLATCCLSIVM